MDLSSLEGPPIQDSRFNISRIHLDIDSPIWPTTPIHPALRNNNNDLPPRPASSGADTTTTPTATPRYHKTAEIPTVRPKSEEITSPTLNLLHPVDHRGFWPLENPERRPRARSQPRPSSNQHGNSGDRLIWLDQERIWIRIEPGHSSTGTGNGKRAMNDNPVPTATTTTTNNNIRRPPTLSHSRSADSYLRGPPSMNVDGTGMDMDMDVDVDMDMDMDITNNDDLPPPYENHYYDPILSPQPARPLTRQNHCRGRVSPWSAVARRMNR